MKGTGQIESTAARWAHKLKSANETEKTAFVAWIRASKENFREFLTLPREAGKSPIRKARRKKHERLLSVKTLPLRNHAERALSDYFLALNGHRPAHLYDLVLREVEEPLFRVVLDYAEGNQTRAATILGINRGTLRRKLKELGLPHDDRPAIKGNRASRVESVER